MAAAALASLRQSASAFRGHVTRATTEWERLAVVIGEHPTSRGLEELEISHKRVMARLDRAEEAYMLVMEAPGLTPEVRTATAEELDGLSEIRAEFISRFSELQGLAQAAMRAAAAAAAPAAVPAGAGGGARLKPLADLKPEQLSLDDSPSTLRSWKFNFNGYYRSAALDTYTVEEQHVFLMNFLKPDLANRVRENDKYRENLPVLGQVDSLMAVVDDEFLTRYPLFNRRLEYFRLKQETGEKFSDFALKLRRAGEEAQLPQMDEQQLHMFRYITGVTDTKLRDRFFRLADPTLDDLKNTVKSYEAGVCAAEAISGSRSRAAVARGRQSRGRSKSRGRISLPPELAHLCGRCASKRHQSDDCDKPFKSLRCDFCERNGHVEQVCFKKLRQDNPDSASDKRPSKFKGKRTKDHTPAPSRPSSPQPAASSDDASDNDDEEYAAQVRCVASAASCPTPRLNVRFGWKNLRFSAQVLPDSGCTRSIVSASLLRKVGVHWQPTNSRLYTANDRPMNCAGKVNLKVFSRSGVAFDKPVRLHALVSSDVADDVLVSWHDLQKWKILPATFPDVIRRVDSPVVDLSPIQTAYPDVLRDELETDKVLGGRPMTIKVREDLPMKPLRILTARPVPLHFRQAADKLVAKLVKAGILARVEEPTEWISAGHFVLKPNGKDLRLVTDYVHLNQYVERPIHPFPSTQDILRNIPAGSRWFAKLDAIHGYFQIPLDERSSYLTTFLLPSGRYRYLRAPMGLSASGDEFCLRSDKAIEGLEFCQKIVDDILVTAPTKDILLARIRTVLDRCRTIGMTISAKKLEVGTSVRFAGHVVSADGVVPDPARLSALTEFPTPTNVTQLRSFLGLANQLAAFVPDSAYVTVKMRQLLKKGVPFQWLPDHDKEFQLAKTTLTSPGLVQFFDPTLPTTVLTDASRLYGIGFAMLQTRQDGQKALVQCGSRSLTPAETRYATIELEMLAIEYAVKKCSFYLRGMPSPFTIVTDHRPLLGVLQKPLHLVENPRLQRLRSRLDGAGFVFSTEWCAGKSHLIADALSRAPVFHPDEQAPVDFHIRRVTDLPLSRLLDAARSSPEYQQCVSALSNGVRYDDLPSTHPGRAYKHVWDELSLVEEDQVLLMVYQSTRIVVPCRERKRILELLHLPHAGITKTRRAAQELYFWPGMSRDVRSLVESCPTCQEERPSQPMEPAVDYDYPVAPMMAVGVDLCDVAGSQWLVMVDRFSGFPFAKKLTKTTSSAVCSALLKWFTDWGFPRIVRSDGGPQFRSEFRAFCTQWEIVHELSSPYNPTSNGLAEAAVKNVKKLIRRSAKDRVDFNLALFYFRNLPRADGYSPAQMVFGRRQSGQFPVLANDYGEISLPDAAAAREATRQAHRALNDQSTRRLPQLNAGDSVWIQDQSTSRWSKSGIVVQSRDHGRSYEIEDDEGGRFLRNRRFLRPRRSCIVHSTPTSSPDSSLRRSARISRRPKHVTFNFKHGGEVKQDRRDD